MIDFGHTLNICTLAAWLSVSGFGVVGLIIRIPDPLPPKVFQVSEVQISDEGFTLGSESTSPPEIPASEPAPVPLPPELPQMAELEPLPDIPGFPESAPETAEPRPANAPSTGEASPRAQSTAGSQRGGRSAPSGGKRTGAGSSGMSAGNRIAAGRMPSPAYPPYSRRNNQQGTVIVEFTVDQSGRVISAYAKKPSPWPLLNAEAVSTVRLWRFPPGGVMTLQRPIVFQLH